MKTNRLFKLSALATAMGFLVSGGAFAAESADQTVTYEVTAINELAVSGDPGALTIDSATAGSEPDAVSDATSSYDITTNGSNKKITAVIDSDMPTGMVLSLTAASAGGSGGGEQTLSTAAADVVTDLTEVAESGQTLTYGLSATVAAGVVASASKTVTLTISD